MRLCIFRFSEEVPFCDVDLINESCNRKSRDLLRKLNAILSRTVSNLF